MIVELIERLTEEAQKQNINFLLIGATRSSVRATNA